MKVRRRNVDWASCHGLSHSTKLEGSSRTWYGRSDSQSLITPPSFACGKVGKPSRATQPMSLGLRPCLRSGYYLHWHHFLVFLKYLALGTVDNSLDIPNWQAAPMYSCSKGQKAILVLLCVKKITHEETMKALLSHHQALQCSRKSSS